MTDVLVGGVMVAPLALGAQLVTPPGHPEVLLKPVADVGGSGLGVSGVGKATFCGSSTSPSSTLAPPASVSAVTLPLVQAPTPDRGVDSDPLIVVVFPASVTLPLVPTLPPPGDTTGAPPAR